MRLARPCCLEQHEYSLPSKGRYIQARPVFPTLLTRRSSQPATQVGVRNAGIVFELSPFPRVHVPRRRCGSSLPNHAGYRRRAEISAVGHCQA